MQADLNRLGSYLAERDAARVDALASLAELRDHRETAAHVKRVSGVSVELLQGWQARHPIPPDEARIQQEILRLAAVTHDLGKVGVPDEILKKPGKLDPAEYAVMKRHTVLGAARIHGHDPYDAAAREVALRHHERWDGKGYPGEVDLASLEGDLERQMNLAIAGPGLAGQAIPLFGRIVALADVYDALRSPRVYKEAWSEERVLHTIREEAGKAFDPELVDIFMERHDRIRAAWAAHPDAPHPQVTSPASAA